MRAKSAKLTKQNDEILSVAKITPLILTIPLIAMQFTSQVDWNLFDFIIMGILLMSTGLIYVLFIKKIKDSTKRLILGIVLLGAFLLVWGELAVGMFGTPFAGN